MIRNDCGQTHLTGLEAIICDEQHDLCTPSMSEAERLAIIVNADGETL